MGTSSRLRRGFLRTLLLAPVLAGLLGLPAVGRAADYSWNGSTSSAWNLAGNWSAGGPPANSLTTDTVTFNLATYGGNPVFAPDAGTTSIAGITIGSSNGTMNLAGTNLSIGSSGITINSGAGAFTDSSTTTTLGANQSWTNNSVNTFTVSGAVAGGANILTLAGTGNGLTTLTGDLTFSGAGGLVISKSGTLGTTISGGTITLGGTGGITINSGASAVTLGAATLGAAQTWTNNSANLFTVNGNITNSTFLLTIGGSGNTTVSSVIGSGNGGLTKTGTGTLTLTNANTYTGATNISSGTLAIGAAGSIANSASVNLGTAGITAAAAPTLTVANANALLSTVNVNLATTQSAFTITADQTIGSLTGYGTVNLASANTLTVGSSGADFSFGTASNAVGLGSINGTNGILTKAGSNAFTLGGFNAYTGVTNVTAGTLKLGSSSALTANGPLGTSSNTLNAGTVVTSGATLDLNGFSLTGTYTEALTVGGVGVGSTGALINNGSGVSTYIGPVTLSNATTIGGTGQISFTGALSDGSGGLLMTKTGTGIDIFTVAAATRTGNTQIDQGTLRLATGSAVNPLSSALSSVILNGGILSLAPTAASSISSTLNVQLSGVSNTIVTDVGTNTFIYTLGTLTFNGSATGLTLAPGPLMAINITNGAVFGATSLSNNTTLTVINNGTGLETLTLGALSDGATARTITKEGGGNVTFNAAASSLVTSGMALTINRGSVTSSAATALGANTAVTVNNNATFTVGVAQTIASLSGAGNATITTGPLTVGDAQNLSTTFSGALTYTAGLTKVGGGTLTLSGPNSGAGAIVVTAGTLRALDLTTTLGTGTMSLNGGTLDLRANTTQTWGVGTTTVNATSTINVQNNGTGSNNVLSIGALNFTGSTGLNVTGANGYWLNTTTSTLTNANQAIDVASGVTFQMGGIVGGSTFGITKSNTGTLILAGPNTYTGATTLSDGTLRGLVTASFGAAGSGLNLNGGTLQLFSNTAVSFTNTNTTVGNSATALITADVLTGLSGISGFGNGFSNQQPVGTPTITHTLGTLALGTSSALTVNSQNYNGVGVTFGATTINGTSASPSAINVGASAAQYSQLTLGALTMGATAVLNINGTSGSPTGSGTVLLGTASTTVTNGAIINVSGGTLRIGNNTALGAAGGTGAVNVNTGATLEIAGVVPTSGNITLNTGAILRGTGTSGFNNATASTFNIASGATVNINTGVSSIAFNTASTGDNFTLTNGINFVGAANVNVAGNGRVILVNNATTNSGTWTVNSGLLLNTTANGLGLTAGSSSVTVNSGGGYGGLGAVTYANAINLSGGALVGSNAANTPVYSAAVTLSNTSTAFMQDPTLTAATGRSSTISGVIGGSGNLLVTGLVSGGGTLGLTNAANDFSGNLTITNSTVSLGLAATGTGAWVPTTGSPTITINQGGVLTMNNTTTAVADRLKDTGTGAISSISMIGGQINMVTTTLAATETIAPVTLTGGFNVFNVTRTSSTTADLTLGPALSTGLTVGSNSVAAFIGTATLGTASNSRVFITGQANTGFMGGNYLASAATATTADNFAQYTANGVSGITTAVALIAAPAASNVRITATPTNTIDTTSVPNLSTLNSLNIFGGTSTVTMTNNATTMTLTSGGLLSSATANVITQGALTTGSATPLYVNTVSSTLAINSFISSSTTGGVVYSGAGTTTLGSASLGGSAANTYTGATYLNNGALTLARAPGVVAVPTNLTVQSGTLTLTNAEQIGDATSVTINNLNASGTLVLPGAGLNETIGSLTLNNTTAITGVSGTGTLILTSTGTNALTVTGGTIASPLRFTGTSGGGIAFVAPSTALAPTLAVNAGLGGPYQTTISGTVDLNSSSTALTRTINVDNGPALIDLNITGALTASGASTGITKTGLGTMRLGVASTYTGLTTVNGGVLSFNVANALGLGGLTVTTGTAQFDITAAANTLPITTTIPTLAPLTVTVNGGTLEFNNVAGTTFGKLVYAGGTINAPTTGTLTLQNPNNNTDILSLDGTTSALTLRGNLNLGAAAVVNNVITSGASTNMVSLDGVLALGSGPRNFIVADGSNAVDLDVTSAISGSAILIKSGAGTMRLSGGLATQNSNSGTVLVTAGTLALNKSGVFGTTGGVAVGTGALIIGNTTGTTAATVRLDQDEQINNANAITINAGGTLNLGGFSETIGAVSINSSGSTGGSITGTTGTLYLNSTLTMTGGSVGMTSTGTTILLGNVTATSNATLAATLTGAINLGTATRTFTVNPGLGSATSDLTVSGIISGNNIGLTKTNAGIMTLSGANTYTGTTTVTTGALVLDAAGSLSTNSAVSIGTTMSGTVNPTLDITAGNKTIGSLTGGAAAAPFVAGIVNIGTRTLTVGSDETSPAAFAGAIIGSSGGLTKTGTGTLTLSNANFSSAYTGATTVSGGILSITGSNALPLTTDVTVASGASLIFSGTSLSSTIKSLATLSGGSLNLQYTTGGSLTIGAGTTGDTTLAGTIDGNSVSSLIKVGTGKLSITGNQNTYLGALTVNQGTLVFSGAGTLPTTAAYTINNGGKLQLDNTGTNVTDRLAATATMTLNGGTFEVLGKDTAASSEQLGTLTLNTGASTINVVNGTGVGSSTVVTFNAAITRTAGTLNITSSGTGTLGTAGDAPRVMFLGATTNTVLPGVIVGGNSMAFYNDVLGVRALGLGEETALNLAVDQSALAVPSNNLKFVSGTASQVLPTARTINSLTIDSPGASKSIDVVGADASTNILTVTTGNIILNGTDNFEIKRTSAAPVLVAASGSITSANPLTFWVTTAATTLTVSAPISGAIDVNKSGAGILTLSGANLYTGSTILNEGTLKLGASNSLYSTTPAGVQTTRGAVLINNSAAVFDIGGFDNVISTLSVISGSITNTGVGGSLSTTGVLTLGTASAVGGAYGSAPSINIGGTGGTGILNLGGDVTYSVSNDPNGATIAGNLALGYNVIVTGTIRVSSGATRTFTINDSVAALATGNANPDLTVSAVVSGAGLGITKAGTGVMLLSGANTYSGPTAISAGQLNVSNAAALGNNSTQRLVSVAATSTLGVSGGLSFSANTVLSLNGTGRAVTEAADLAFPGALNNIADSNSFAGMVTLPASATIKNSASGTTLTLSGDIIHGAAAPAITVMGAGNVTFSGAINTGTGTLIYNSTNTTPTNATLTLSGTTENYYTGATTINAGAVVLNKTTNGTNAIGIGALTIGLASGGPAATLSYGIGTAGNDQINDYTPITLNQSGTINMNGVSDTIGSLTSAAIYGTQLVIPGSPTAPLVAGIPLVNGSINLGTGGATLTIGAANTSTSFGGVISGTGASNLVKIGTGVQTLTNASTYAGSTTITHGGITLGINNALPTTTALTVNSPLALTGTTGGLYVNGFSQTVASLSGNGTIALGTGGILSFGGTGSFDGIIGGALQGTTGGLFKTAAGDFALNGANTIAANIFVQAGSLTANNISAATGAAAPIWLSNGTTLNLRANTTQNFGGATQNTINIADSGASVTINVDRFDGTATGNVFTLAALNMGVGNQTLNITGTAANTYGLRFAGTTTLTPDTTSTFNVGTGLSLELGGAIALTNGAIVKSGSGLMILSGANTQTGTVALNGGTLRATVAGSLGASISPNALTLTSGTLDIRGNAAVALARNVLVNGNSSINADILTGITGVATGPLPFSATPAVIHTLQNLTIGAQTLSITGANASAVSFTGLTTLTGSPTFDVASGGYLRLNQITGGANGYTKSSSGIMELTGPSGLSGAIALTGGMLRATTSAVALGTSTVTVSSAATLEINNIALTSGAITLNGGAILQGVGAGAGFSGLSNPLTVASGATVNIQTGTSSVIGQNVADVFTIGTNLFGAATATTPTQGGLTGGGSGAIINIGGQGRVVLASNTSDVNANWNVSGPATLQLGGASVATPLALGNTASTVTLGSGAVLSTGSIATTVANAVSSTGGSIAGATGAVTPTYVSATTLTLTSGTTTLLLGDATALTTARSMNINGQITGAGNLNVTGLTATTPGTAALIGATTSDFTGNVTITQGTLTLGANVAGQSPGKWAPASGTPTITLNPGGALTLDNRQANVADRLADTVTLSSTGGTVNFFNLSGTTGNETIGNTTLSGGLNTIANTTAGAAVSALTIGTSGTGLTRSIGATATFTGTTLGTGGNTSRIIIFGQTTTAFLGGGFISGTDFVKYDSATNNGFALGVTPLVLGDYQTATAETSWASGQNLSRNATGTTTLTGDRTANSLKFITTAPTAFDLSGKILTLESGGLIFGVTGTTISDSAAVAGSGLTAGTAAGAELFVHNTVAAATISSRIVNNTAGANSVALVYSGTAAANTLTLSGANANTYSGGTYVNGGTLTLNKTAGVDAIPGDLTIHSGTVALSAANQINNASNVTINGLGGLAYGNLSLGTNNETINTLTINSIAGAVNNVSNGAGSTLTLQSTATNVLTMTGGQINLASATANMALSGTSGGGINIVAPTTALAPTTLTLAGPYQSIITGTAGSTFNLNTSGTTLDRTFTVADGPAPIDLLVTTILTNTTGSNVTGIIKAGAGTMRIGTAATYNGSTTVSAGTLSLNIANATPATAKGSNAAGISTTAGDNVVNVNGGTLNVDIANAIGSGANLNVAGGTVNFNNFAQTIRGLGFVSGTINAPLSAALTITPTTNNDYALQLGPVSSLSNGLNLTGNLVIGGATTGNIIQTSASATSNVIGGALSLGTVVRTFDVANGGAAVDLDVSAALSGASGGFTKIGLGTMQLSGDILSNNSYTGATTVNAGTLILNKTGLVMAASTGGVALGSGAAALTIGNTGTVLYAANEQIANAQAVNVSAGGTLNLAGFSDTIGALSVGSSTATNGVVSNSASGGSTLYVAGITINGGTITLDGSGGTNGRLILNTNTIATTAGTAQTNSITAGSIILTGNTTVTLNNAADVLTINGVISGNGVTFTKAAGAGGTLILNGTNTFNGATSIAGGTLQFASNGALSSETTITITGATTTLDINGKTASVGSINSASAVGIVSLSTGTAGSLTIGSDDSAASYGGTIINGGAGAGTLTKVGIGTQTFIGTAANTYTGLTTVSAGGLTLAKTAGLNAIGGDLTIGPATGGTGTQTVLLTNANQIADTALLTVNATGIFNLGAGLTETVANLSGSGLVTANTTASVLTLAPSTGSQTFSGIINATTPSFLSLTVAATGTSQLTLSGTQTNNFTGTTTVGSSSGTFTLILGKTGDTVSTIPSGTVNINSGGKIQFAAASGVNQLSNAFINGTQYPSNTVTVASGGSIDFNGVSAVMGNLTVNTGGSIANTAATTFTLNLGATAGSTLTLGNVTPPTTMNIAFTNPTVVASGITTTDTGAGATITIAGNIDLNTTAASGITRTFTIANATPAVDVDLTGIISSSGGPTGITKAGAGTLKLSGTNTYTGGTVVSVGTLQAGSTQAFGLTSAVNLSISGAILDLNNLNNTIGSLTGVAGSSITLGSATLTVGTDNTSPASFLGDISGTGGSLVKTGVGTLTLGGANNTFNGGVTVTAGTLTYGVSSTGAIGSVTQGPVGTGTLTLNAGTTLKNGVQNSTLNNNIAIVGPGTVTYNNTIATTGFLGPVTVSGGPTLNIADTPTGSVSIDIGLLTLNSDFTISGSSNTTAYKFSGGIATGGVARQITLNNTGTAITFSGPMSLTGSQITFVGSSSAVTIGWTGGTTHSLIVNPSSSGSVFTFNGASTYTGGTTLSNGTLTYSASSTGAIGAVTQGPVGTGTLTLNAGTTLKTGVLNLTLNNNIAIVGPGTVTYNNTIATTGFLGPVTVSGGPTLNIADTATGSVSIDIGLLTLNSDFTISGSSNTTAYRFSGGIAPGGVARQITLNNTGKEITFSGPMSGAGSQITLAGSSTVDIIGSLTGGTAHSFNVNSSGTVTFNGASTYTGGTTLSSGTLAIGASSVVSGTITSGPVGTGTLTVSGGTIKASTDVARTLNNNVLINDDTTIGQFGYTTALTFDPTVVTSPQGTFRITGTRTLTLLSAATFGGTGAGFGGITNTSSGGLVVRGPGTLTLTNSGTQSAYGTLTVGDGTTFSGNGVGGNVSALTTNALGTGAVTVNYGGTLTLGNVNYANTMTVNVGGSINLGGNTNNGTNITIGSMGSIVTTGSSAFQGTLPSAGALFVNAATTATKAGGITLTGSTLAIGGTGALTVTPPSSATGLTVSSASTIAFNASAVTTFSGTTSTTLNAALTIAGSGNTGLTGMVPTGAAGNLGAISGGNNITVAMAPTGMVSLTGSTGWVNTNIDRGTLLTGGTNIGSGTVTINGGTLRINATTSKAITVGASGGALEADGTARNYSGVLTGGSTGDPDLVLRTTGASLTLSGTSAAFAQGMKLASAGTPASILFTTNDTAIGDTTNNTIVVPNGVSFGFDTAARRDAVISRFTTSAESVLDMNNVATVDITALPVANQSLRVGINNGTTALTGFTIADGGTYKTAILANSTVATDVFKEVTDTAAHENLNLAATAVITDSASSATNVLGGNTLTISAAQSYTGTTTVTGVVRNALMTVGVGAPTLTLGTSGELTKTSAITVNNNGILNLGSGSNTGASGGALLTVKGGGTVNVTAPSPLRDNVNLTLGGDSGGGTYASTANNTQTLASLTIAAGNNTVNANATGQLTISGGAVTRTAPGGTLTVTNTSTLILTGASATNVLGGWAYVGTNFAAVNGSATVIASTPSGNDIRTSGADFQNTASGTYTLNAANAVNSINLNTVTNAPDTSGFALTVTSGGILASQAANINATGGGTLTSGYSPASGVQELFVNNSAAVTIAPQIIKNANGQDVNITLTKLGAAVLTLSNSANQIGDIYVNAGTLTSSVGFRSLGDLSVAKTVNLFGGTLSVSDGGSSTNNTAGNINLVVGPQTGNTLQLNGVPTNAYTIGTSGGTTLTLNGNLLLSVQGTGGNRLVLNSDITGAGTFTTATQNSAQQYSIIQFGGNNSGWTGGITNSTNQVMHLWFASANATGSGPIVLNSGSRGVAFTSTAGATYANDFVMNNSGLGYLQNWKTDGALSLTGKIVGTAGLLLQGYVDGSGNVSETVLAGTVSTSGAPTAYSYGGSIAVQRFVNAQGGVTLGATEYQTATTTGQNLGLGSSGSLPAFQSATTAWTDGAEGYVRFSGANSFIPGAVGPGYVAALRKGGADPTKAFGYLLTAGSIYALPEGKSFVIGTLGTGSAQTGTLGASGTGTANLDGGPKTAVGSLLAGVPGGDVNIHGNAVGDTASLNLLARDSGTNFVLGNTSTVVFSPTYGDSGATSAITLMRTRTGTAGLTTTLNLTGAGTVEFKSVQFNNPGNTTVDSAKSGFTINVNAGTLKYTQNDTTVGAGTATYAGINVGGTGTLSGGGTINGAVTINSGGTLSPGNSPGTLTVASANLVLMNGGNLNWQIVDANGAAGTGYDTTVVSGTGTLNLSNLTGSPKFNINLWSLSSTGPDVNGNAANFNDTLNYTWTLISTPTAITGFSSSLFDIKTSSSNGTSGFSNSFTGTFDVMLANSGKDLVLTYTGAPVPEPHHVLLICVGAMLLGLAIRRRMRAAAI